MFGPTIQGSCFVMRAHDIEEASIYASWFADTEVTRWLMNQFPPSLKFEQDWIDKRSTDPNTVGWTIEVDGRPVGITGVEIDWKNRFGVTGTIIGDKTAWGRGIGGESMKLRRDYCFRHLGLRKLRSGYVGPNKASERAQLAAGYREVGRYRNEFWVEGEWVDHVLTEMMREEWEAIREA